MARIALFYYVYNQLIHLYVHSFVGAKLMADGRCAVVSVNSSISTDIPAPNGYLSKSIEEINIDKSREKWAMQACSPRDQETNQDRWVDRYWSVLGINH